MDINAHWLSLIIFFVLPTQISAAQLCRESLSGHAVDERFKLLMDGTVVDHQTHLVWMRCSVGQRWDAENHTCAGEAQSVTWFQAKQLERAQTTFMAHWRLPTIHELSSITELRCFQPAIDLQRFPNTPASHYWSATPFANKPGYYWLVQFLSGENHTDVGSQLALVRWVKTLDQSTHNH
jgi:hypothetical protein